MCSPGTTGQPMPAAAPSSALDARMAFMLDAPAALSQVIQHLPPYITSNYIDYQPEISANPVAQQPMQAPINAPYQSVRFLPPLPANVPATSQPFLGFSSLAPPSSTRQANQARLSSASATIPRQPQVQPRSRTSRRGATASMTTVRGGG
jgi:hypothetical protein